ncbi:hypothetical protein [Roseisolibacter sp. H3M3-2]|uniref:hypothetical protein n=1 Tax=Roseisolibacter sp. H3M3-2 TaxID=3031323 RepID=UPI0023DC949B|nr:hypothetical protein [Roseisolibacter sp. H3M3-2]MDF1503200.1 hypothetical protein [Roseisolibacter sp. H3M3-2]
MSVGATIDVAIPASPRRSGASACVSATPSPVASAPPDTTAMRRAPLIGVAGGASASSAKSEAKRS